MTIKPTARHPSPARKILAILFALIAPAVWAQSPTPALAAATTPLTFEVATIKPSSKPGKFPWAENPTPDGESWVNVSLQYLAREAYGATDDKLWSGGPAWLDTQRFDVVVKFGPSAPHNLTFEQRGLALQALLAERFKLKLHTGTKDFPVFNLVIAKGGPKLRDTTRPSFNEDGMASGCLFAGRPGYSRLEGCTMTEFAGTLRYMAGRTVVDRTGLTGRYDLEIPSAQANPSVDSSGPSIFTAVQEDLGLKLEPATAPLQIFVIDSAEMPTEN